MQTHCLAHADENSDWIWKKGPLWYNIEMETWSVEVEQLEKKLFIFFFIFEGGIGSFHY